MADLSWDDFRLVKAIADARSLAGAATRLGINASTVFRRLGDAEKRLGARLFERHRSGYALTPAGEEMTALATRFEEDASSFAMKHAGRTSAPSGEIRVTTSHSMLVHLMTPIMASFRAAYDDIRLDVVVSSQPLNLSRRDADVAVRVTDSPPENLVGRRVATMATAVYAAADLAARCSGPGGIPPDMPIVRLGNDSSLQRIGRFFSLGLEPRQAVYSVNNVLGLVHAVEAGIGVGPVPCFIADQRPDLVRLTRPNLDNAPGVWILTHPELRQSPRVRAFLDHVTEALVKRRALIEGATRP